MASFLISIISSVLLVIHTTSGLQCFTCLSMKAESSVAQGVLNSAGILFDKNCVDANTDEMISTNCTTENGKVPKCVHNTLRSATFTYGRDYVVKGAQRRCVLVDKDTADICTETTDPVSLGFDPETITISSGQQCYCSTNNCTEQKSGQSTPGQKNGQTTPGQNNGQTTPGQNNGQTTPKKNSGQTATSSAVITSLSCIALAIIAML